MIRPAIGMMLCSAAMMAQAGRVVVADRGAGTITVIDARSDIPMTVPLPPGERTPEPMYVVYSAAGGNVFVGDRGNSRVVVFDARDFSVRKTIPAGAGVFHMWASQARRQLWVVNELDRSLTVINTQTLEVESTVAVPADLVAMGGRPHDVILDPHEPAAYLTVIGLSGPSDAVVKFNTQTLSEEARQQVGKDPHVSLTWRNHLLYVPCQGANKVFVLDRRTMEALPGVDIPNAHGAGMTQEGSIFYTTNIATSGGDGIYAVDTSTNAVVGSAGVPHSTPHNIAIARNGSKLYVTHSGANAQVSVYRISRSDPAPVFVRTVQTGANPFGIESIP